MRRNKISRKNKRRSKSSKGARESSTVKLPVKLATTFTYAAAQTQNAITLEIGGTIFSSTTRIYHLARNYTQFRFTQLHVTMYPFVDTSTADNVFVMAYLPATDSTAVQNATFAELTNINSSCLVPAAKTMPTTLSLGQAFMLGTPQKWFPTNATTPTINAAIQGSIVLRPRANSTATIVVSLSGIMECKVPTLEAFDGGMNYIKKIESICYAEEPQPDDEERKQLRREEILRELKQLV